MRPFGNDVAYTQSSAPGRFVGHDPSLVPASVTVSRNNRTYPSGSRINPGYAYGTFLPLIGDIRVALQRFMYPYTVPVASNKFNQVRIKTNTQTQWINPLRALKMKGLTTSVPGVDHSGDTATQRYLGNAQG